MEKKPKYYEIRITRPDESVVNWLKVEGKKNLRKPAQQAYYILCQAYIEAKTQFINKSHE